MLKTSVHIISLRILFLLIIICSAKKETIAQGQQKMITVDQTGKGDFKSIQDAINSLPEQATAPRIIFIRKGIYKEKIFVEKNFVSLIGEDRNNTQLVISLAR